MAGKKGTWGGARRKAELIWDEEQYYLDALKNSDIPLKAKQQEYTRLRIIANRRLERFEVAKEKHIREAQIYKENVGAFRLPASKLNEAQLNMALSDVAKFINSPLSSVRGQNQYIRNSIEAFHENGYDFVNKNNYWDFTDYLTEMHSRYQGRKIPDSDRIVELYEEATKHKVKSDELLKNFDEWRGMLDDLKEIAEEDIKDGSASDVKKQIKEIIAKKKGK